MTFKTRAKLREEIQAINSNLDKEEWRNLLSKQMSEFEYQGLNVQMIANNRRRKIPYHIISFAFGEFFPQQEEKH